MLVSTRRRKKNCIKKIMNIDGVVIWVRNTNGVFSIKSAYFLDYVLSKQSKGESSNGEVIEVVWRKLWQLQVLGKIKQFL